MRLQIRQLRALDAKIGRDFNVVTFVANVDLVHFCDKDIADAVMSIAQVLSIKPEVMSLYLRAKLFAKKRTTTLEESAAVDQFGTQLGISFENFSAWINEQASGVLVVSGDQFDPAEIDNEGDLAGSFVSEAELDAVGGAAEFHLLNKQ
jgi:hypothetical protein